MLEPTVLVDSLQHKHVTVIQVWDAISISTDLEDKDVLPWVARLIWVLEVSQYATTFNGFDRVEEAYPTRLAQPFVLVGVVPKFHAQD